MPEEKKEEVNTIAEDKKDNQEEKDRTTEQFEKLTKSNKELKEERDKYKNVLDSLHPEQQQPQKKYKKPVSKAPSAKGFDNLKQGDIDEVFKSMVDDKGYLDGNKLFGVLKKMDARTTRAEEKAERVRIQAEKERIARKQQQKSSKMQEVHDKYPRLDPENKEVFDSQFYELVRNDLIGQMMDGKEDPMAAADKWSKVLNSEEGEEEKVAKEKTEEKEEKKTQKEQINAVRPKSSSMTGYYKEEEDEALREKVRKGKRGALAEVLRRREERNQS